jgi:hypothetical protein
VFLGSLFDLQKSNLTPGQKGAQLLERRDHYGNVLYVR